MAFIQRNSTALTNVVYTTEGYNNPNWIVSLSPSKVGSGIAQWNAAQILGAPITLSGLANGDVLKYNSVSGLWTNGQVSGSSPSGTTYGANSGVVLTGNTFSMGGTGYLKSLNISQSIASEKVFIAKGAVSQTASVIEAQNASSSTIFSVGPNGTFGCTLQSGNAIGFTMKSAVQQQFNYLEIQNDNADILFAITPTGSISGALAPAIVTSTGMTLTNLHHGKIIEHTGNVSGTYTLGAITNLSWQCMLVNFASGIVVSSGSNVLRSYSGYRNISDLYGSASMYRRQNGEFFLYGSLN